MVDHSHPEQTIWTLFDHNGPCLSNRMVRGIVNHGQMVMVIFSQSWSSLMVDLVILTMVIDRPSQIQEKLQYETWPLCLFDELNF